MAQANKPVYQKTFKGIVTAGSVLDRPEDSAVVCKNFRIMPGEWLRLRGGRTLWIDGVSGNFTTLHEFRKGEFGGGIYHVAEQGNNWVKVDLTNRTLTTLEAISSTHRPEDGAITTARDKTFWANGRGTRDAASRGPALSSWDGSQVRYVGLDPFIPATNSLAVSFTPNPSGNTVIIDSRKFWVGLYNSATGHFSNVVYVDEIVNPDPETSYVGDLSITGLSSIERLGHDASETAEIYYVVYASLNGSSVPYLVLDPNGYDILKTQSASVSIELDDNTPGLNIVDSTKEGPIWNHPPRAMRHIAYANGRVYGALMDTTTPGATQNGFSYDVPSSDETAICWSAAADDVSEQEFLGVPEESFPTRNKKYLPNGEVPKLVQAIQGNYGQLIVISNSGTFMLEETLPGVHIWRTVSWTDGIWDRGSFSQTPYGCIWLTQKKELVLLKPGSDQLTYISKDFNSVFRTGVGVNTASDYLSDPANYIDRYQIWLGTQKSLIYDFAIGGQAYTADNQDVGVAKSMTDSLGQRYHVMCIGALMYVQEAHPFTGVIPVADEETAGVYTEINGDYIGQWQDFGDPSVIKELKRVGVVGDANHSTAYGDTPLLMTWYGDLSSNTAYDIRLDRDEQSDTEISFSKPVRDGHRKRYKFRIRLYGRRTEGTYYLWQEDGELDPNHYGSIYRMHLTISGATQNRPH